MACLQTGDEEAARKAVGALTRRFGADNERVMALMGLCDEIAAGNEEGKLRKVLEGYERVLGQRPENLVSLPLSFFQSLHVLWWTDKTRDLGAEDMIDFESNC